MHSPYLSHLVEIGDGSRHALAINSKICAAFCILPVYNQLLALEYRYTHATANVATNTTAIPCKIGAHDPPVFSGCQSQDLSTGASYRSMPRLSWLVKLYENLHYSVKDIRNDVRQIIYIIYTCIFYIYIYEESQLNRLVWGSLTLAPIINLILEVDMRRLRSACRLRCNNGGVEMNGDIVKYRIAENY